MFSEVIYEKKFPKQEMPHIESSMEEPKDKKERLSFEEIINKIYKDVVYVLDPVREKRLQGFIDKAIEISELYELDIKINKHLSHVTVDYFFDGGGDLRYLLEVIKMADSIAFFPNNSGYALVVCLDFYTHFEYRNGRQINP